MIESVGYTEDGLVWMRFAMQINGEKSSGVLQMYPDEARNLSDSIVEACDEAIKVGTNVGDSKHDSKDGSA